MTCSGFEAGFDRILNIRYLIIRAQAGMVRHPNNQVNHNIKDIKT